MLDLESFCDRLRLSLGPVLRDPVVSAAPGDFRKVTGFIISPDFEGLNEGQRQELVWSRVREVFDESERGQIEFLYTDAPSELVY